MPRLARHRGALSAALALLIGAMPAAALVPAAVKAATPFKLALVVGPMGAQTPGNRSDADAIANQAKALGVTVTKAYSPNATYPQVRAAVAGANVVVYFGHGNGYPNPYGNNLLTDRVDGWGLNTTTTHGDQDSWSNGTLVFCGEKALEGKLTSTDGAAQRTYCAGGAIQPAAGFVMVYVGSCYTAGSNEPQNPQATTSEAIAHAAYYSRPMLTTLGASGYFAGRTEGMIVDLLAHPSASYGDIWNHDMPSGITGAYGMVHPLVSGLQEWLTHQTDNPWWYYAFAGNPARTLNGGTSTFTAPSTTLDVTPPKLSALTPVPNAGNVPQRPLISMKFSEPVRYVSAATVTFWHGASHLSATVSYSPTTGVATVVPAAPLQIGATYTVKVSSTIADGSGNHLAATSWSFRAVTSITFSPARHAWIAAGAHTGYQFSSTGAVTRSKTATIELAQSPTTTKIAVIAGHAGIWLYMTSGTWAGYWLLASSAVKLV